MRKFLWRSVLAVFLVSSVALGVNDDLNAALQLLKAKLLSMAQSLSPEKKVSFDIEKAFPWIKIRKESKTIPVEVGSQYCFGQQVNGTCMIWPWVNLKILETLVSKCEKYIQEEKKQGRPVEFKAVWGAFASGTDKEGIGKEGVGFWASHRLWWGRECEFLFKWNDSFKEVVKDKFFEDAITKGPVFPNVYGGDGKQMCFYETSGACLFKNKIANVSVETTVGSGVYLLFDFYETEAPLVLLKRLMSIPYFFADREETEKMAFDVDGNAAYFKNEDPIGTPDIQFCVGKDSKTNYWYVYNTDKDLFEEATNELDAKQFFKDKISTKAVFNVKCSGYVESGIDKGANLLARDVNSKKYSIYTTGLYKLVLLRLGLNSENEEVTEGNNSEGLWPVVSAMRTEFNKGDKYKNPWSDYYMSKETLLEYHLANIFKNNTGLFEEAKKVCDFFFQTWEVYQKMINVTVYGKGGKSGVAYDSDTIKKYLPGPEQMMAMIVMRNVIGLWWGAMKKKAFYNALGINKVGGDFNKDFVAKADEFIKFWQKVVNELKNLPQKHFASFTSHGWVVSFDDDLIKLQNSQAVDNIVLLKKLGIAGIESWHSKDLPTFYKRGGKEK